jgi:hypothetical protein
MDGYVYECPYCCLATKFKALCGEKNMAEWWNGRLLRLNEVIVFQSQLLSRMCFSFHEVNVKSRQQQAADKSVCIPIRERLFHYSASWCWCCENTTRAVTRKQPFVVFI